ncbi:uncharacterized protein HD556DRAFT_1439226 [Suillus plorans]|uniref:DUF6533 domain-containing protein n=1 Tax=Suillus plorans TaxID=116603 RepID=A0A9P7J2T1_9AGAM|nr:uncharacterized protein HD556DRAFT_1439226 [Suillus plorans]KAG1800374.1 hypothetical protein HD556DRAFT_1439226 [Suillus plorans]
MTIMVSNDPTWWPTINAYRYFSYFVVAAFVGVTYDWVFSALTLGQEVELIWRQRWSVMTALYLGVRYLGISYAALYMLSLITSIVHYWTFIVVFAMLWVIIIIRLHAMYQRSRKILIFLIVTFLAVNIFSGVVTLLMTIDASAEQFILSGTYECWIGFTEDFILLESIIWILVTVWEVLALCLAVWIAVKHFRELRRHSTGGIMGDCFTILMTTHMLYFASFVVVSCCELILDFSPILSTYNSLNANIISGFIQISEIVQMFVLGPRLILGIREYHAKLVADADAATGMTSIAFQEHVYISTGSDV